MLDKKEPFRLPPITAEWNEDSIKKRYHVELDGMLEKPSLDVFGDLQNIYGQYAAFCRTGDNVFEAVRDPLGIAKLFYVETPSGKIRFSERFDQLFQYESPIYAVPAGMHVRIAAGGIRECLQNVSADSSVTGSPFKSESGEGNCFRDTVQLRLEQLFKALRELEEAEQYSVFVALSGGLDSSIIAAYATRYLKAPIACTLDLGKSEDSEKASRIADSLGIKHLTFPTGRDEILKVLEEAPSACQDFRDFNVHCAVLNLLLARNVRGVVDQTSSMDAEKTIILTGDLMNEFTCDYAGEVIDGVEYYKLPRIGKKDLQRYLVKGLDTSDRELSPFGRYGLKCIQPYAVLYDLYMGIDERVLLYDDPKKFLNSSFVSEEILSFIPKVKLRAQVGSRENMGILGICHSQGIGNRHFKKGLLEQSGYPNGKIPIFVGRYDVESFVNC